ncbi:molybdenum cofactor biosynthesis protein MoaE [Parapusillimonas granuli]|uniref:Molybdopterin synthase catalytic subunit n=1 Tax=Parapusillimonas granuli TaxID=380911 RepID=A0A853G3C1_9BURK|nr:molybdenum cofactor biosynthesis protein MoaE [Parapusillimonas granuli]MBB5215193.1 molybdopterin synthase catalytic subunit [Parapusillimonas granuli]MEB2401781.1 molybdenum cofactor biosynthesis protein MoaE [Alcaligenaceae bacterium]NYT49510.1 molybdenum cofactor biosynthesis protein MoaE [Parapusillimonas granuli]
MVVVQEADFDAAALQQQLRRRTATRAGAIVTFTGYVRDYASDASTHSLFLEHYPGMCEREIEALCAHAKSRWDIDDCLVVHRVGELANAEQIVFVAVASAHRGEAFRACEYLIDALKTRAPFWKRETLADGKKFWVEQRQSDHEKTEQWNPPSTSEQAGDK